MIINLGMGFSLDQSTAVPVSSTGWWVPLYPCHCFHGVLGSPCWMWTTQLLPSSHPIPCQVQGKGLEASPNHICGCRAPLAQQDPGDRAPMEITVPALGVLPIKWFILVKKLPSPRQNVSQVGLCKPRFMGKKEKPQVWLWDQTNMIFQKCCGFNSFVSSWGTTGSSAFLFNSHYLSGILRGDGLQAVSGIPKWFRCSWSLPPKSLWCS